MTRKLEILDDMIDLCTRRERRAPQTRRKSGVGVESKKRKRELESPEARTTAQSIAKICKIEPSVEPRSAEREDFSVLCNSL